MVYFLFHFFYTSAKSQLHYFCEAYPRERVYVTPDQYYNIIALDVSKENYPSYKRITPEIIMFDNKDYKEVSGYKNAYNIYMHNQSKNRALLINLLHIDEGKGIVLFEESYVNVIKDPSSIGMDVVVDLINEKCDPNGENVSFLSNEYASISQGEKL